MSKLIRNALLGSSLFLPMSGDTQQHNEYESAAIEHRVDEIREQARWLVDQILHDADYEEIFAVLLSTPAYFRECHPRNYRCTVALAKLVHDRPDIFSDTHKHFVSKLQEMSTVAHCIEIDPAATKDLLNEMGEHDQKYEKSEQVMLADILAEYERQRATLLAYASVQR